MPDKFTLKQEHLTLLTAASWRWDDDGEYGGPAIDCKRPFGNSGRSQILADIREALGRPSPQKCVHCGER